MKSLLYLVLTACIILTIGCNQTNTANLDAQTDSLLKQHNDQLFTAPQQADKFYDSLQIHTPDSAAWHRIEVFRATAAFLAGDTTAAQARYNRVIDWCQRNPEHPNIEATVWNHKGVNASIQGDNATALTCYRQVVRLTNHTPKGKLLIIGCINLADCYMKTGQIPEAADYYRQALTLSDSLGDKSNYAGIWSGLGLVYMELRNFEKAHHAFDQAAPIIEKENLQAQFYYYTSRGNCYYYEENYTEALNYFEKSNTIAKKIGHPFNLATSEGNLAEVYLMREENLQAESHLEQAIQQMRIAGDSTSKNYHYLRSLQADLATSLGHPLPPEAAQGPCIETILKDSPRYLMLHYRRQEHYAGHRNDYNAAYQFKMQADHYAELLHNLQNKNYMAELSIRYTRDTTLLHKEVNLAEYKTRNALQRNFIMALALGTALLIILTLVYILVTRSRNRKRTEEQMQKITELRMDIVRNRVSPHYIFNVMCTILPKLQKNTEAKYPVELLIDVLRGNLLTSGHMAVALRDELRVVNRYVELYHHCNGPLPRVTWEICDELQESTLQVPSMSLQIPVENALKHAFPQPDEANEIHVAVTLHEGMLHLSVTDNGNGYNPGMVKNTGRDTGTGLRLIARTLDILNQRNPKHATLSITNLTAPHHGTCIVLTIPTNYVFTLSRPDK